MGRKLKADGYVARQQVNAIKRATVAANKVLDQLLTADNVTLRATLIAQAAILNSRIGSAVMTLEAIWSDDDGASSD